MKTNKSILKIIREFIFGKKNETRNYYEYRMFFKPIGKDLEIGVEESGNEPDEKQMNFFNWLENNYDLIIQKISPSLEKQVADLIPNYKIQDFKKEYILEFLYIPKCDKEIFDWEISFYADNELQHWCVLSMKGTEVKKIFIDG